MQVEQPGRGSEHEDANANLKRRPAIRTELQHRADPTQEDAEDRVSDQLGAQKESDWRRRVAALGLFRLLQSRKRRALSASLLLGQAAVRAFLALRDHVSDRKLRRHVRLGL